MIWVLLSFICVGSAAAQKPDFSGTWLLDKSKSKDPFAKSSKTAPAADPKVKESDVIVIEHLDPEFTATEKQIVEKLDDAGAVVGKSELMLTKVTYFTDGRGEINPLNGRSSKTKITGRKIVVTVTVDEKDRKYSVFELTFSKDGKEMTIINSGYQINYDSTTRRDYFFAFPISGKKVYTRVDK